MNMKRIALLLLCLTLLLGGCSPPQGRSEQRAAEDAGIEISDALSVQMPSSRIGLVFYQGGGQELGCALIEKGVLGWRCTGKYSCAEQSSELDRGMTFANAVFKRMLKRRINISYGIIADDRIDRVEIVMGGGKPKEAEIIGAYGGGRLWYVLRYGGGIPDSVKGIADSGQLIYMYPRNR